MTLNNVRHKTLTQTLKADDTFVVKKLIPVSLHSLHMLNADWITNILYTFTTYQTLRRSSIQASWSYHTREEIRSHLPFYIILVANVCRQWFCPLWHAEMDKHFLCCRHLLSKRYTLLLLTLKNKTQSDELLTHQFIRFTYKK